MPYSRPMITRTIAVVTCLLCVGCAVQGSGFERHSLSRLSEVPGSAVEFIFEAGSVPGYDKDDPAAEATRMQWLSEWLKVRGACEAGYEVTERRPFAALEYNPQQSELRYAVRCRADPAA